MQENESDIEPLPLDPWLRFVNVLSVLCPWLRLKVVRKSIDDQCKRLVRFLD
jgi:hypothetical protein